VKDHADIWLNFASNLPEVCFDNSNFYVASVDIDQWLTEVANVAIVKDTTFCLANKEQYLHYFFRSVQEKDEFIRTDIKLVRRAPAMA
jgi:hypothetical protein